MSKLIIGIIGGRVSGEDELRTAEELGELIAGKDAILACGGLGGVMEAAARGAKCAGGLTLGILPGDETVHANPYIDVPVATGLGIGRNVILARTSDALIAVSGEYGTLSEIAFGLQMGKPVVGIGTWDIDGIIHAADAKDAVRKVFEKLSL